MQYTLYTPALNGESQNVLNALIYFLPLREKETDNKGERRVQLWTFCESPHLITNERNYHYFFFTHLETQRGKFYPQLTNLVRINTPRAVQTESRKAFKKLPNLESAVSTLCTLKGVGTTLASGSLAIAGPYKKYYQTFYLYL
jgi:hypothetical protein